MTYDFISSLKVCQSYKDYRKVLMKGNVEWNLFTVIDDEKERLIMK